MRQAVDGLTLLRGDPHCHPRIGSFLFHGLPVREREYEPTKQPNIDEATYACTACAEVGVGVCYIYDGGTQGRWCFRL